MSRQKIGESVKHFASERRRHAIDGESERETLSDIVAVGSIVHELETEPVLLVDTDVVSLSLTTSESDHEFVWETVSGRLDVAVEEKVLVHVALSVVSRLAVSDDTKVCVYVVEADGVAEREAVKVLDVVNVIVGVGGIVGDGDVEIVPESEVEGLGEALKVGGGETVAVPVTVGERL